MPFTIFGKPEECSRTSCQNLPRYFIECKNNFTESIYVGQCCDKCLPKAIEDDYKITGYLVYSDEIEKNLPERKTNADFGHPSGIFDMKSLLDPEEIKLKGAEEN